MNDGIVVRGKKITSKVVVSTIGGHFGLGIFPYVLDPAYLKFMKLLYETGTTQLVKSSTFQKRRGNFIWYDYRTWQYVQRLKSDSMLNSYSHTNMGVLTNAKLTLIALKLGFDVIPNFAPDFSNGIECAVVETLYADRVYARILGERYKAIEIVSSCPNRQYCVSDTIAPTSECIKALKRENSVRAVGAKKGIQHPQEALVEWQSAGMDFFHGINAIPFKTIFPGQISPLEHVGGGAVSGGLSKQMAFEDNCKSRKVLSVPMIFGCCNHSLDDAYRSLDNGADAISICTVVARDTKEAEKIVSTLNT